MLRTASLPELIPGMGFFSRLLSSKSETPTSPKKDLLPLEGLISLKYFSSRNWLCLMIGPFGKHQYAKFASLMISRIRAGLSNFEEVQRFHDLILSSNKLWQPVMEVLPEWGMGSSQHARESAMAFLIDLIKTATHESKLTADEWASPSEEEMLIIDELNSKQMAKVGTIMFGEPGPGDVVKQLRIFQSTIQAGFPRAALAARKETDLFFYDLDGLPAELFIRRPTRRQFPTFSTTRVPMMMADDCFTIQEIQDIYRHDQELKIYHKRVVDDDNTDEPPPELLVTEEEEVEEEVTEEEEETEEEEGEGEGEEDYEEEKYRTPPQETTNEIRERIESLDLNTEAMAGTPIDIPNEAKSYRPKVPPRPKKKTKFPPLVTPLPGIRRALPPKVACSPLPNERDENLPSGAGLGPSTEIDERPSPHFWGEGARLREGLLQAESPILDRGGSSEEWETDHGSN